MRNNHRDFVCPQVALSEPDLPAVQPQRWNALGAPQRESGVAPLPTPWYPSVEHQCFHNVNEFLRKFPSMLPHEKIHIFLGGLTSRQKSHGVEERGFTNVFPAFFSVKKLGWVGPCILVGVGKGVNQCVPQFRFTFSVLDYFL